MHTLLRILTVILILLALAPVPLYAHGEDMLGPHGGFIRMPGTYHTEVIPQKDGIVVMLLDINFKNPSVKDSSLTAAIKVGKKVTALKCEVQGDHYFCPIPNVTTALSKGTLEIDAMREKIKGAVATYSLPLKHEM